jgi:hypothetical protein
MKEPRMKLAINPERAFAGTTSLFFVILIVVFFAAREEFLGTVSQLR